MARHLLARSTLFTSLALAFALGSPSHVGAPGAGIALAAHVRPMRNGELAFVDRGKHNSFYRIAVINPDGSGLRGLTPACTQSWCGMSSPSWSPDGASVAFLGQTPTGRNMSLFVVGSNGRGEKLLAHCGPGICGYWWKSRISWAPDGSRIIFAQRGWLAIVNVHTGSLHRVMSCTVPYPGPGAHGKPPTAGCSDWNPLWSPDGSRIMFSRTLYARHWSGVEYTMNPNGSGLKPLLGKVPTGATDFAWSPNGHSIVFDTGDTLHTVNADGSHLRLLLSGSRGSGPGVPSWSPDGTHILYFSTPGHAGAFRPEVWVMNAAGTYRRRLCITPSAVLPIGVRPPGHRMGSASSFPCS